MILAYLAHERSASALALRWNHAIPRQTIENWAGTGSKPLMGLPRETTVAEPARIEGVTPFDFLRGKPRPDGSHLDEAEKLYERLRALHLREAGDAYRRAQPTQEDRARADDALERALAGRTRDIGHCGVDGLPTFVLVESGITFGASVEELLSPSRWTVRARTGDGRAAAVPLDQAHTIPEKLSRQKRRR